MTKRCPVCGEMNPERNRFCGNCGAELAAGDATSGLARGAEQFLYDVVRGAARTFFELRDQLEASRWTEQSRGTVDQAMSRLKDAVEAGRREYEERKRAADQPRSYEIPLGNGSSGGANANAAGTAAPSWNPPAAGATSPGAPPPPPTAFPGDLPSAPRPPAPGTPGSALDVTDAPLESGYPGGEAERRRFGEGGTPGGPPNRPASL